MNQNRGEVSELESTQENTGNDGNFNTEQETITSITTTVCTNTQENKDKTHMEEMLSAGQSGSKQLEEAGGSTIESVGLMKKDSLAHSDAEPVLKVPQEFCRLNSLLSQIPKKAQHGLLMQCDLILTCIDASESFIALGTNVGLIFLFNRKDMSMQRLKSEASNDVITCIKLHCGLDHQLAVGTASGAVYIFLIPGAISLHKKQLQKFEVRSVHRHYITCVEWSTNGMKLFSGDKTGHVICTEVDFFQGQCKSAQLLADDPTDIVQLHYDHKVLLVSTSVRSFVCRLDTNKEIVPIGHQERKMKGNFGACFIPGLCKTDDAKLYAVRPGCRIWFADIHGVVSNTHIFKDQISESNVYEIPLLHPSKNVISNPDIQFGKLFIYREKQLVTYNSSTLFILDSALNCVVARQARFGGIVDVAISDGEIWVLRRHAEDAVVRIAPEPEKEHYKVLLQEYHHSGFAVIPHPASEQAPEQREIPNKESSSPKSLLKKTFIRPFKKLDNLIQEHRQAKDLNTRQLEIDRQRTEATSTKVKSSSTDGGLDIKDSSPDLPPVVSLDSPELAIRVYTGSSVEDVASPDSAKSALSVFVDEVTELSGSEKMRNEDGSTVKIQVTEVADDKVENNVKPISDKVQQEHLGPIADRIHLSTESGNSSTDIVFSHVSKKKKANKKKTKDKLSDQEGDNISQASFNSQASEDPPPTNNDKKSLTSFVSDMDEGVSDIIRRAEIALSSVSKLLRNDSQKQEVLSVNSDISVQLAQHTPSDKPELPVTNSLKSVDSILPSTNVQTSLPKDEKKPTLGFAGNRETKNVSEKTMGVDSSAKAKLELPLTSSATVTDTSKQTFEVENKQKVQAVAKTETKCNETLFEDPLVAAEKTLMAMKWGKGSFIAKRDSSYDIYSNVYSPSEDFDFSSFPDPKQPSLSAASSASGDPVSGTGHQDSNSSKESTQEKMFPEAAQQRLANSWSEFTAPANIYSLGLSTTHVWFSDKSENLYYSSLAESKGIVWRKVADPANQISVAPLGHIVWRLHRGTVYASTKITHRRPEGLKWVEAVRDVSYISADDHCAWYVKSSGEVMMQRWLSKERPCFSSLSVESRLCMKKVMARHGIVWGITDSLKLVVRTGITKEVPQGLDWLEVNRSSEPILFSSVSVDHQGIGWAIDVLGQIWFTEGVTTENPVGSGKWWQVPLSEYYVQDPTTLDMIRSIAKKFDPQKLSLILSTNRGGLIVVGTQGVWLSLEFHNTLHVCRGSLQGFNWSLAQPPQMAAATAWKQVQASVADLEWGLVWAQQVNGELYALSIDSRDATLVSSPTFVSLAVNEQSVWGLTSNGEIYIRTGVGPHCPLGSAWCPLDLSQLGDLMLVHLSCNSSYVWAVDSDGHVFNRIGAAPPKPGQLNPVWLSFDSYSEIVFTKVNTGPYDWMVWAIDNRRLTYVRVGITEEMPIGREWVHVPGIQAVDITLTKSGVWALNTNGHVMFRHGINPNNLSGDYWKKIPGIFAKISASASDVLWGVNNDGQLVRCCTRFLLRRQDSRDRLTQRSTSVGSEEGDWELV